MHIVQYLRKYIVYLVYLRRYIYRVTI